MDAAMDVMQQLNERAAGDETAQRELTSIYLSLGNDLSEQLKTLQSDPSKSKQLATLAEGFRGVLDQISSSPEGTGFRDLYWVASTYTTLGQTLTELDPEASKKCFTQAGVLYDRLLADPEVDEQYHNQLRVRLAESYRHVGTQEALQKAINLLLAVLNTNENLVDAQQEACQVFERWGDANHQGSYFDLAINGYLDATTKRRLVWGWGTLAAKVQRSDAYREKYHLARLNLADCRFKKAMTQTGEARNKTLKQAKGDIAMTLRVGDATLGGDEWRPQYDRLLKSIQRELQEPQIGLKEFDTNN